MSVTCIQAAEELGVSASQVRRWVQSGAPVARERRPMLVDVAELQRWRQHQAANVLDAIAIAMLHGLRCEVADGKPAHRMLGIDERRAAALLLATYARVEVEMTGHESEQATNDAIAQLRRIAGATS